MEQELRPPANYLASHVSEPPWKYTLHPSQASDDLAPPTSDCNLMKYCEPKPPSQAAPGSAAHKTHERQEMIIVLSH